MKLSNAQNGFTLIELLVAMNIAFITITFIVSFYLFTEKFVLDVSRGLDWRSNKDAVLYYIGQVLKKSTEFEVTIPAASLPDRSHTSPKVIISTKGGHTITVGESTISLDKDFQLPGLNNSRISIALMDGHFISIMPTDRQEANLTDNKIVHSYNIKQLQIELIKGSGRHTLNYSAPLTSSIQFRNIGQ